MNKSIGVLFDIDRLGGPSSYGPPCWRILMKRLDLREMPGVTFYQGDLEIKASQRPYCYCIAISEFAVLTGGQSSQYFKHKLSTALDAGLFPFGQRFVEGDVTASLIPSGHVDLEGRFRMSPHLGDLGDLRLVSNGLELGWTVLPDEDLLARFAATYLAKTGDQGVPLADASRALCESVLREVGQRSTIAALEAAGLPPDELEIARERLTLQVWPDPSSEEAEAVSPVEEDPLPSEEPIPSEDDVSLIDDRPQSKKWWQIWR